MLEGIKRVFGGSLLPIRRTGDQGGRRQQVQLIVFRKGALQELVRYLDRFPLRSKKGRDYVIWRGIVETYLAFGAKDPRLPSLVRALKEGRKCDPGVEAFWRAKQPGRRWSQEPMELDGR